MAKVLDEAAAAFGEEAGSPDIEVRQMRYEAPKNPAAFDEIDEQREKLEAACELALDRYAIEHAESFK